MKFYKFEEYADGEIRLVPFDPDKDYLKKWVEEYKAEFKGSKGNVAQEFYDWVIEQVPSKVLAVLS